ncbi:MAG TPA: hypothetical protein VFL91_10000 [Thermomicrobiales bacterium]|nr:hypothetical protein [Thermomicrobiales bacterium]
MTQHVPVHPFTGLEAIGFRRNGEPIWPVRGGSEDAGQGEGDQGDDTSQDGQGDAEGDKPEIDWKAKSREWERKAKANAGAAKKLAEIEESSKTEAQKAADRATAAEQRAIEAEAKVLRRDIALEHKLSKDDAALLDALTDEDAMRALAARLGAGSGKKSNYVPREGSNPNADKNGASDEREFARNLFGSGG